MMSLREGNVRAAMKDKSVHFAREYFEVRCTSPEKEDLLFEAAELGLSLSDYVLYCTYKVKHAQIRELYDAYYEDGTTAGLLGQEIDFRRRMLKKLSLKKNGQAFPQATFLLKYLNLFGYSFDADPLPASAEKEEMLKYVDGIHDHLFGCFRSEPYNDYENFGAAQIVLTLAEEIIKNGVPLRQVSKLFLSIDVSDPWCPSDATIEEHWMPDHFDKPKIQAIFDPEKLAVFEKGEVAKVYSKKRLPSVEIKKKDHLL